MTFKKNWSVSAKNWITACFLSSSMSKPTMVGAISFKKAKEAAMLRWWNSSPIAIALVTKTFTFNGSRFCRARLKTGPKTSRIHFKRSITSGPLAPNRNTAPIPSFIVQ